MTLILTIDPTAAGAPPPLVLDRRDAVIGRAPGLDWTLADPRASARHCEIGYRNGAYLIRDTSTNGTQLNGAPLVGIQRLADGDVLTIGGTTIRVGEGAAAAPRGPSSPTSPPDAAIEPSRSLVPALAGALSTLLATRARQRGEIGASPPASLDGNPLAGEPAQAATRLATLAPGEADAAIAAATDAIERHHAATVQAMAASLRVVLAEVAPDAIVRTPGLPPTGEARDAALWRAFVARFDGEALGGKGFVDRFSDAFRASYERLTATG